MDSALKVDASVDEKIAKENQKNVGDPPNTVREMFG